MLFQNILVEEYMIAPLLKSKSNTLLYRLLVDITATLTRHGVVLLLVCALDKFF